MDNLPDDKHKQTTSYLEPTIRQAEGSQPAEAMAAPTESIVANVKRCAEPVRADRPAPLLGSPREPTEFELEPGVRQLIDALMDVILENRSITERDVTQISGLGIYCHHRPLADQLRSFWNDSTRSSRPDADNHAGGQSPTSALQDHKPAEVDHPLNRVWIDWGSTALKKYRTAEAGTKLWFVVQKKADGHARIMYQSDHRHTNARTDSTRRGE